MSLFLVLKRIFSYVYGSKKLWVFLRHYRVLSDSFKTVETVFSNMQARGSALPTTVESQALLTAMSNLLKTGIIDFEHIDEYEIALKFDYINEQFAIGMTDKMDKKFSIPVTVKRVAKKEPVIEQTLPDIDEGDEHD